MYREYNSFKFKNSHYLLLAVSFIIFNYYVFMFHFMSDLLNSHPAAGAFLVFFFHICFFLMFWSLIRAIISDPGRVPVYWGLFIDDPDNKKRRYCLICHIFKPVNTFYSLFNLLKSFIYFAEILYHALLIKNTNRNDL